MNRGANRSAGYIAPDSVIMHGLDSGKMQVYA